MFPRHARRIMLDMKIKNLFDLLTKLYDMGYKNVTMVVGADRINEFDILIKKYNAKKGKHGFYNFRNINVFLQETEIQMQKVQQGCLHLK